MLGANIGRLRRQKGLTQEQLAQKLDVTNQAVSKWETDQCCPDVAILPKLADIFDITIDELFGRAAQKQEADTLPWDNDGALHFVVYDGHRLLAAGNGKNKNFTFCLEGPVRDICCHCNLECGDVAGSIRADGQVECGDVGGAVSAGGYVECGDVGANVKAGGYTECGDVGGAVSAGGYVECGDVSGNVTAADYVECGDVSGNITAAEYVECGVVGGKVTGEVLADGEEEDDVVRIEVNGTRVKWNPFKK